MMSETKWTPGPWRLLPRSTKIFSADNEVHVADARGYGCFTGKGHGAMGLSEPEALAIMFANGHIIAAAPDLYEALDACEKTLDGMAAAAFRVGLEGTSEWDQIAGGNNLFGTRDKVREALSKARGEE